MYKTSTNDTTWITKKMYSLQIYILIVLPFAVLHAQDGTYRLQNENGSYGLISLVKNQNTMTAEIFTWWNTPSAQTGSYYGQGIMSNNRMVLKSNENDPDCTVKMSIKDQNISAKFEKCMNDLLTEDFNGTYRKISDAVAGNYVVKAGRSFFYSKADEEAKQKSYLIKGDTVSFNIDGGAVGNWVFVHYRNQSGKDISGFIKLTDLKKL